MGARGSLAPGSSPASGRGRPAAAERDQLSLPWDQNSPKKDHFYAEEDGGALNADTALSIRTVFATSGPFYSASGLNSSFKLPRKPKKDGTYRKKDGGQLRGDFL